MPLNKFVLIFSYILQALLNYTASSIIINATEKYLKNNSTKKSNTSPNIPYLSLSSTYCNSADDCNAKIANSWCNIPDHQCYCHKGYQMASDGSCLLQCADDDACFNEDINRLCLCETYGNLNDCITKLCKCKTGYYQNPSQDLCDKDHDFLSNIDNNGLIIVCVVTGVSPLSVVIIAICCRKLFNRGSRARNRSSGNLVFFL